MLTEPLHIERNGGAGYNPTRKQTLAFWKFMAERYNSRVVWKRDASMMKAAAIGLSTLRILDRDRFLDDYTTVIGRTIYAPFELGGSSDASGADDVRSKAAARMRFSQIITCTHEHQHIEQRNRDGAMRFSSTYLLSQRARVRYEAEAYACNIQLRWWRDGTLISITKIADQLVDYGVNEAGRAYACEQLAGYVERVKAGEPANAAMRVAFEWLSVNR